MSAEGESNRTEDRPAPTVSTSLRCRRCRYELRGIAVTSACPECGDPIWQTIAEAVDLTPLALDPALSHRIGRGLPWLALGIVGLSLGSLIPWLTPLIPWDRAAAMPVEVMWLLQVAWLAASSIGVPATAWSLVVLRPGGQSTMPLGSSLSVPWRLLTLGLVVWTALAVLEILSVLGVWVLPLEVSALAVLLFAAATLAARLGPASRRWRGGGSAIQEPATLLIAFAVALLAIAIQILTSSPLVSPTPALLESINSISAMVALLALLLGFVGGGYLIANLLWIARDLRRRSPELERLLSVGDPADSGV